MPLVTAVKRHQTNRDIVTSFIDVAYTTEQTFTFPDTNNRLEIQNSSAGTLTLTVNSIVYTILPFKSQLITDSYTSFTISSTINSAAFECTSIIDNEDDAGSEVDSIKEQLNDIVNYGTPVTANKTKFVAHAGVARVCPENTIPGIELAYRLGFWGCELDVSFTSDNIPVLMHDATVDATTNGTGNIYDMTLAQVQTLIVDSGYNISYYKNLKIPTLEEALITCKRYGIVPIIELKRVLNDASYDVLLSLLKAYGLEDKAIMISFILSQLQAMRSRSQKLYMQFIADINEANLSTVLSLSNAGFSCDYTKLTKELVNLAHSYGLAITTWNPLTYANVKILADYNVDMIASDTISEVI